MDNSFLQSSVLPGMPVEHHEHKRLVMVLVVLIILGLIGLVWWLTADRQGVAPAVTDTSALSEVAIELKKAEVSVSAEQKAKIVKELDKAVVPITTKQKADFAAELKAAAKAGPQ